GSPKITKRRTRKPRTRPQKFTDPTTKRLRTRKPRTSRRTTASSSQTHAFNSTLGAARTRAIKTSMTSVAALPTSTQPTSITLFGMDITDFVTGIEDWFNALDGPVKYAMIGGAVFLVLLILFCCYRKFAANTEEAPQPTVVIVQEEPRRKRRPWSRTRFRSSTSESRGRTPVSTSGTKGSRRSTKEVRYRYSAKQKRPPDRTRQGRRPAEPEAGTAVEKRRKSYEDRQGADVFKAPTAPTMEGTAGTAATDETMQSTDGPLAFPPPPPPPAGAGPMRAVGRVALSLRQLLRRSSDDRGPARADILDMMGNVPENALGAPPGPPPPPAAGVARSSGTASAPGYEEVGGIDKALLPGPATQPKRW
ncbi:hypothetical protein GCK32_017402, partial [Trichostrongylus colubriformis]